MAVSIEAYLLVNFAMELPSPRQSSPAASGACAGGGWRLPRRSGRCWAALIQLPRLRAPAFAAGRGGAAVFAGGRRHAPGRRAHGAGDRPGAAGRRPLPRRRAIGGAKAVRRRGRGGAFLAGALLGALALVAATDMRKKRMVTWEVRVFPRGRRGRGRASGRWWTQATACASRLQRPAGAHLRARGARGRAAGRLRRPAARRSAAGVSARWATRALGRQRAAELLPPRNCA